MLRQPLGVEGWRGGVGWWGGVEWANNVLLPCILPARSFMLHSFLHSEITSNTLLTATLFSLWSNFQHALDGYKCSFHFDITSNTLLTATPFSFWSNFQHALDGYGLSQATSNTLLMLRSFLSQALVTFNALVMLLSYLSQVTSNTLLMLRSYLSSNFQHALDSYAPFLLK